MKKAISSQRIELSANIPQFRTVGKISGRSSRTKKFVQQKYIL